MWLRVKNLRCENCAFAWTGVKQSLPTVKRKEEEAKSAVRGTTRAVAASALASFLKHGLKGDFDVNGLLDPPGWPGHELAVRHAEDALRDAAIDAAASGSKDALAKSLSPREERFRYWFGVLTMVRETAEDGTVAALGCRNLAEAVVRDFGDAASWAWERFSALFSGGSSSKAIAQVRRSARPRFVEAAKRAGVGIVGMFTNLFRRFFTG